MNKLQTLLLVLAIFLSQSLSAQLENGYNFSKIDPSYLLSVGVDFNHQDATIPIKLGFIDKQNLWSAVGEYGIRPFRKKVEIEAGNNLAIQYREIRHLLGIYVEKAFLPFELKNNNRFGFTMGTSFGGQLADYRGAFGDRTSLWVSPYAGFMITHSNHTGTSFGYRFDNVDSHLSRHKIFINLFAF